MDLFPKISFELNYEWSSEEDEGEEKLNPSEYTSKFVSVSSVELNDLEKSNILSDQKAESAVPVKRQSTMQSPETYFTGCTINGNVQINVYKEMKNHEKSKKHREMVALLRQQLQEEEESLGLNVDEKDGREEENGQEEEEEEEDEEEDKPRQKLSKKQKRKKKQQKVVQQSAPEEAEDKEEKPKPATCEEEAPEKSENTTEPETQDDPPPTEVSQKSSGKTKGKKAGGKDKPKNVKSNTGGEQIAEKEVNLRCVTCNNEFSTRNKLFDHLKTSGHATAVTSNATHSSMSKSKKDKKKSR